MKRTAIQWTIIAGVLTAIFLWLWGIHLPYVGIYNANNNYLALASENFLRFGYRTLHFLPTYFAGEHLPAIIPYYLHHPVLFFLLASLPFALFGSANWVVHVAPFIFAVASLVTLYVVIRDVAGSKVALFSAVMAAIFPMMSFFWKYIFFEQPSLFFSLASLFFFLRYVQQKKTVHLISLFLCAFLGGATDWYGVYLVVSLIYLYFVRRTVEARDGLIVFLVGVGFGLGTYVMAIVGSNSLGAALEGFSGRSITSEITSLSVWPVRLILVTLVRLVIYFSPLLVISLWQMRKHFPASKAGAYTVGHLLTAFLIMGLINPFVLPAATWGHSYFLYYLIPFCALVMGLWLAKLSQTSAGLLWLVMGMQVLWSVSVNGLKMSQVKKQSWKFDFAREIQAKLPAYSLVGVYGFPGDVLEHYAHMPTFPLSKRDVEWWATGYGYKDLPYVAVTCADRCQDSELEFVTLLKHYRGVYEFRHGENVGWLFAGEPKDRAIPVIKKGIASPAVVVHSEKPSLVLRVYRYIRDLLGSTQI